MRSGGVCGFKLNVFAFYRILRYCLATVGVFVTYRACLDGKFNAKTYEIRMDLLGHEYGPDQEKNCLSVCGLYPIGTLLWKAL